jgi:hypothetical protein
MGAAGIPEQSHDGGEEARTHGLLSRARGNIHLRLRQPSTFGVAIAVVVVAIVAVAALTYWGARTFSHRAADERAAEEATSFAAHSSLLATGDAFNGYLQILAYADDPFVRDRIAQAAARRDAMQALLWLNTNRMSALAIADRSGLVLASTDASIRNVRESDAFNTSRANLGPANSDIVLPDDGGRGYVEFAAPIREADGSAWGFLYARAEPQTLWRDTLNASIDGGHNVIINSEGRFAAGVPDAMLGQPWKGAPLDGGGVRADIAGTESICGLGTIGKDTQIDHGSFIASCLPASLIQTEAGRAMGSQAQVTLAGAVLAIVVAAGGLKFAFRGMPSPGEDGPETERAVEDGEPNFEGTRASAFAAGAEMIDTPVAMQAVGSEGEASSRDDDVASESEPAFEAETIAAEPVAPTVVVVADVDALSLIDAYERRNALMAEELRESIRARLMVAATQAEEAYRLAEAEPERAAWLHREAMGEIEAVQERELRGMGQELHPSLVRLGLPSALRSLAKEFEGRIDVRLRVDANVDGASSRGGRVTIEPRLRLVLYRIVRDALRAALDGGAEAIEVALTRDGLELEAAVRFEPEDGAPALGPRLLAGQVALQAFGGTLTIAVGESVRLEARVLAPHVEQAEPEVERDALVVEPEDDASTFGAMAADEDDAGADDADVEPDIDDEDDEPTHISTFTPREGEPEVVEATGRVAGVALPATATTFRLPEDEPSVVEAEAPDDGGDDGGAEDGDPEHPSVVQVTSLAEAFGVEDASAAEAPGDDGASDAA